MFMRKISNQPYLLASVLLVTLAVTGCASPDKPAMPAPMEMGMMSHTMQPTLDGAHEVPPNDSAASGVVKIMVGANKSVSGNITTTGIDGKAAHIHDGAAGANGPVIVPLSKTADSTWSVPAGAVLSDAQYADFLAGNLYVNVHSAAHPGGEIRAQLTK